MVWREWVEGMGIGIGMEGVWVAYICCIVVYCVFCYCLGEGWGLGWDGLEGLLRLFIVLVIFGVRLFRLVWLVFYSL